MVKIPGPAWERPKRRLQKNLHPEAQRGTAATEGETVSQKATPQSSRPLHPNGVDTSQPRVATAGSAPWVKIARGDEP